MKVARLSALHTGRLYLQETFLVLISFWGWVDHRVIVRPAGLCQWQIPVISSWIETVTLRFVAQCLNQLHHRVPNIMSPYEQFSLVYSVYCEPQLYYSAVNSTRHTLSWILHMVTHFVKLAARMYQLYSWGWLFKGWNMLEWCIGLIKWRTNDTRGNFSVVIWYRRREREDNFKMDIQKVGCQGMY
jgi:hypothetical protein